MVIKRTNNFAIHLIKDAIRGLDNIVREAYRDRVIEITLDETPAKLYISTHALKPPKWSTTFKGLVEPGKFGMTMAPGAVVLVEAANRTFAITFGTGRYMLEPECWEERFGLLVVLNSIKENAIKSIDKKTIDSISRQTREQASRDVGAHDFGLDVERDLLRAVTGTPEDKELGLRLYGMDSLKATVKADLADLPKILPKFLERYKDKSYKDTFPWIDQLSEVKRKSIKITLNKQLLRIIEQRRFERCWLAPPDIIEWDVIAGFRYGQSKKRDLHADLDFEEFLAEIGEAAEINDALLNYRVCSYDTNDTVRHDWPLFNCINCELDDEEDKSFLLSGGKWYRIAKNFVQEVDKFFSEIERYEFSFPAYQHKAEGEYNEYVVAAHKERFVLGDKKNIAHGGGQSKIEFCDIYDLEGGVIHVKRYGGSSVLSHLFAQGMLSGELFKSDPSFQKKVNKLLGLKNDIKPEGQTIVFAVISKSEGEELELPFFSRLNLKHAVRRLRSFGYEVKIAKSEL